MKKSVAIILFVTVFLSSMIIGGGVIYLVKKSHHPAPAPMVYGGVGYTEHVETEKPSTGILQPHAITPALPQVVEEEPIQKPEPNPEVKMPVQDETEPLKIVSVGNPIPESENCTYALEVKANRVNAVYKLYRSERDTEPLYVSNDGNFSGIAGLKVPKQQKGAYWLRITCDSDPDQVVTQRVDGFRAYPARVSIGALSKMLSQSSADKSVEDHFASKYKMHFIGLHENEPKPTQYTQIYSNISARYWEKVEVTKAEFDAYNRVIDITIKVKYVE